jgi:transcriptional regulator with XRE-family HTH domain
VTTQEIIPIAVRGIRKKLGLTMAEFAETLGSDQSTISRYESGQLIPSRTVLILLYLLSSGTEREAIEELLGSAKAETLQHYRNAEAELRKIPKGGEEPPFLDLLNLLRDNAGNRKLRAAVAQMLPYLEFIASKKS